MTSKGTGIHVRIVGDGPPLLLLHGFTGAGAWWDPFVDAFAEDYSVLVPDLPGHGRSEAGPDPYRFDEVGMSLFRLMDEIGVGRFRAIGYSGGAIALTHMALQQPDRVASMVVMSAPHVHDPVTMTRFADYEDQPSQVRDYWAKVHSGGEPQVRRLIGSFQRLGEQIETVDVSPERLGAIRARTLIVVGDRDPECPVELMADMYRAIPDAALWIIPGQGHMVVWSDWGGSAEAASIFPAVARRHLGTEPL